MDVFQKTLCYIVLSSELLLLTILLYRKLQKLFIIYFNSFYLLLFNLISLLFFNLLSLIPCSSYTKYYLMLISLVFFFSYINRIKKIIDCISLSMILKSSEIKDKAKLLYEKLYYPYETFYFICFIILSITTFLLFYFLQNDIITKYTLYILSILIFTFFCYKILKSDMRKKYKKNYITEIILSSLLFSNLIFVEINANKNNNSYYYIILFIIEILFIICIYINCYARQKISEDKLLISKKLKSDFNLFFNNELCFYAFNSYLNKNESDSNFYMKLYIDINKYKMKICLNEKPDYIKNIIDFFDNNEQIIKNSKVKEKIKNIIESRRKIINDNQNQNQNENNIIDEIFTIVHNLLNTKFESFKKSREYQKIFFLLDLLYFLDEVIFIKSFYYNYIDNEELQYS